MLSRIDFSGDKEALRFLDAVRKKLINPEAEAKSTALYIEKTIIPRRFEEQKNPTGSPWKPSQRVLAGTTKRKGLPNYGNKTLTMTGALRHGLKPNIKINSGNVDISFIPSGDTAKYAYIHNNGGKFRNRSGKYSWMPKRQYAFTTQKEKMIIIRDIWVKGLLSA